MNPVRVVIDTNVLVAALKSKRGASYRLLMSLVEDSFMPSVSVPLFVEYESVLKRPGLVAPLGDTDIDDILNYVLARSSLRRIFFLWRPFLKDPKDDLVLEVAVESQSEYIITFNMRDFQGVEKFGIKAVTSQEFLLARGIAS